jgi:hypothetical protein
VKDELRKSNFDHLGFGQCGHPTTATADAEAAALLADYILHNPKCSKNPESGHRPVTNHTRFGDFTTYLAYYGCFDV